MGMCPSEDANVSRAVNSVIGAKTSTRRSRENPRQPRSLFNFDPISQAPFEETNLSTMKTIHALGTTVSTLAEVSTTHAAIVTTPAEIDAFYDKAATNCTGVSVFVRIFATCGTERTEDEAVYDEKDASKTMFCVPNRAKYLGEANLDEDGTVTIYDSCNTSATPHRQQPASSFDTGECIVDADGESSAKYYSVGQLKPTASASATGDVSGSTSTSAAGTPSTTTSAPVTTSTGSTSSATSAPVLCSIAFLLVSTALSVVVAV
ncbi:hypothetical protein PHYSODRAFT_301120 [Phytophthora sojae]|uniref:Uncharacterized protein n=1 Tax=Phytophthora sojae (strain P6497) TaxID=1094619 RepID=G4ZF35_PHYSP|nr:hypothetical protein PHYSODRAFT_301120 [Phytophthora sojae]EGZ18466.1 hypothetical protein PHYSODRAFT_301120 [Phytophthora sojae]|eukprot:XP_009527524.1 hypothetical protein PHYSODRAFT_301120 [Phytophthora sojae]